MMTITNVRSDISQVTSTIMNIVGIGNAISVIDVLHDLNTWLVLL